MKILLPQVKQRPAGHRALFDKNQPYQPKKEKRRDQYQRRYKNLREFHKQQGSNKTND